MIKMRGRGKIRWKGLHDFLDGEFADERAQQALQLKESQSAKTNKGNAGSNGPENKPSQGEYDALLCFS